MSLNSSDPTVINSVAITAEDLTSALEMNRTSSDHAVLRITPPFSGRMRARLHVELDEEYDQQPKPVHVEPSTLVDGSLPSYPRPSATEDALRADSDREYTVERHHEYHATVVDEWRAQVPDAVTDRATIETPAGPTEVDVSLLGGPR